MTSLRLATWSSGILCEKAMVGDSYAMLVL